MKVQLVKGSASVILTVFIQDSTSTTGAGLGSLDQNSSIVGGYVRMGGTGVALAIDENVTTEGTYQAPSAVGNVRIGTPANMRTGIYELHFHNDLFASGADLLTISLGGASNMADLILEVQLTGMNLNDSVRGGMTALPNAAADAAGGLPISDAGGLDLDAIKVVTDAQAATGSGLTAIPWNAAWDAEVQSKVNDALVALGLDHLVNAAVAGADVTDDSIIAKLVSASGTADWDDFVNTTESLQALRDRGDAAWTTGAGGSDRLLMVDTTIATLASQTSFTLAAGSSDNDAYLNCTVVIEDAATATQKAIGLISEYVGATRTVTLKYDPGVFTMAATDKIYILAENALKSAAQNRQLDVTATGACDTVATLTGHTVQTGDTFARIRYFGLRGPGVFLDDGAANTNTVVGVDGVEDNPVSTIAAATTIAGSLGIQRIYLINHSVITLAQTYEGWEFVGIGLGNQITLGSQDVDNSSFFFMTLTGTQGGTGMLWVQDSSLTGLVSLECIAFRCYLTGTNTIRASSLIIFQQCESAVPGNATPELTFSGGASSLNFRHYSGGLQLNSMGTGDTMSYESDGQIIVDASCTDGLLTVRGDLDVTDNAEGRVTITQTAAINQANINAAVDTALSDYDGPTKAEMDTAHALLATVAALTAVDTVVDAIKAVTDLLPNAGALSDLAAILADTNELQTDDVPGLIAALNNLSAANVNAEVVDVISTDTSGEPAQGAPPVTASLRTKQDWMYKVLRNKKTQNATDWKLYDDAGTTVDSRATVSADGTTATKEKIVTGP